MMCSGIKGSPGGLVGCRCCLRVGIEGRGSLCKVSDARPYCEGLWARFVVNGVSGYAPAPRMRGVRGVSMCYRRLIASSRGVLCMYLVVMRERSCCTSDADTLDGERTGVRGRRRIVLERGCRVCCITCIVYCVRWGSTSSHATRVTRRSRGSLGSSLARALNTTSHLDIPPKQRRSIGGNQDNGRLHHAPWSTAGIRTSSLQI